ncbi:Uma2 family endonuclease [Leptolyngbya sp. FACHB-402]|uniref:Uma2 family endonuclease n=1 Tax=unclassified Leptolyngbya TaxID=2650499 RepID=UPI001689AAB1|nr:MULTISPECIES: Uma2 family endonuclease [unclassified Leptolyngbya]MBD2373842.1 Uma2 family endonuclease [Leptolyngbya sp. FACHB-238]MBD2404144.1 Uma2 family endonuclease [Leptolyngbya sp. FACHB-402]
MVSDIKADLTYPESDGKPMSDNTKQFEWIVLIKKNLDLLFQNYPNIFVAGDLLWYPVEGKANIRVAPDAMVVFGRPKGDPFGVKGAARGAYVQHREGNIPPQVVFEILSPSNTQKEMDQKLLFYDRYGVEEYYLYDPDTNRLRGWLRTDISLEEIDDFPNYVSPRLGIWFDVTVNPMQIYRPNGEKFLSYDELDRELQQVRQQAEQAQQQAEQAQQQAEQAQQQAEQAQQQAEQAQQRANQLAERLRQMGVDPDQL